MTTVGSWDDQLKEVGLATATATATMGLERGWSILQAGIVRLTRVIEGSPDLEFSASDYMALFTVVYNMCTQNLPFDYSQQLYDRYALAIKEYTLQKVLPSLREKRGESFLEEFVRRWSNHKVMVTRLSEIFHYLDRYFVKRRSVPNLMAVGLSVFRDLVYHEMKIPVRESVIFLVNHERDGMQINKHLIKQAVSVFLEIGNGSMAMYDNDFEAAFLENSFNYYLQKARCWLMMDSCMSDMQMLQIGDSVKESDWVLVEPVDFTQKVQECLNFERNHVLHYLHSNTEKKLLEKVEAALLSLREHFAE